MDMENDQPPMTESATSMLTHCPLCGSELECSTTPGKLWCCSPECGACFVDIDPAGYGIGNAPARGHGGPAPEKEGRSATRSKST
jgi:hypothetical protein